MQTQYFIIKEEKSNQQKSHLIDVLGSAGVPLRRLERQESQERCESTLWPLERKKDRK
jgi:hypothetical protein